MRILPGILPIIILTVYGSVRYGMGRPLRQRWPAALMPLITAGVWWVIRLFCSVNRTDLIVLMLLELFSFEVFQVRQRQMSFVFHGLFYLGMSVILGSGLAFQDSTLISEYLLMLIYFLTESNQLYLKKTYEESVILYQNQLLTKQVNEVQNMYMTMRGWRHDYHNHLQTLKAHLKLNQVKEAENYLNRLESDLDHINYLIESGNVNLDAILNSKLSLALKEDIDINYKAEVPAELSVSDIDLCVLIGNLIDNAVEACNKLAESDGDKFIRLYIGVLKKQLYISVTNATNEIIRKLDEDYITTKRGNHGHGLKRINNIVEKYEGYINRKNEPGVFVTEIMLPL